MTLREAVIGSAVFFPKKSFASTTLNALLLQPERLLFRFFLNRSILVKQVVQIVVKHRHMIKITESAKAQVAKLIADEGHPEHAFVRVGVDGGGCSGLMYKLEFDTEMKDGDQTFEDNGVTVVVDRKSFLYLVGTELEYTGGLNGKGFVFNNPNASRTCGCGESFSI
jgi:iron-sulfur cluster assembly protein